MQTLLILGATGLMGGLIAPLAERYLPDTRLLSGSRRLPDGETTRRVEVRDRDSVLRALEGVDAVINAVGPYYYDPTPLVGACIEAGCHYLDLAETPEFILRAQRIARRERASVALVSGCSTVPGLIQALAQRWAGRDDVGRVRALLSMGSANPVTPTLMFSLLRPLGSEGPAGTRYFARLTRREIPGVAARLYGRYPSLFDWQPLKLGARPVEAPFYSGFDRAYLGLALRVIAPIAARLGDRALDRLSRWSMPLVALTRPLGTHTGVLSLEAVGADDEVVERLHVRAEREGLCVPALPSVWAARRLLADPTPPRGEVSLADLLTSDETIAALREHGYAVAAE